MLLSDLEYKEFVKEINGFKFYRDYWTMDYERQLRKFDANGVTLHWKVFLLVRDICTGNDMEYDYVAYDEHGKPRMSWRDSYEFDIKKICIKQDEWERNNIITMAKERKGIE